jgi:two-component system response regulator AtoC
MRSWFGDRSPKKDQETTSASSPIQGRHVVALWEGGFASHPLTDGARVTIGRAPEAGVAIRHTSVSRAHAAVHGDDPPTIEDLFSANGIRVNGALIPPGKKVAVSAGSLIEVGEAIVLIQDGSDARRTAAARANAAAPDSGDNPMERLERILERLSSSAISVLILGETGAGKGMLAERIHRQSPRSRAPFLPINCAALPESLLESELFGYERGAFTGATTAKAGLFEAAAGGTVLLDEVGEMPLSTQVKLLRVLENREVMRIGGRRPEPLDVRIIAATNRDLETLVSTGSFREDLYFRLNVMALTVPPLRERRGEIEPLARAFIEQACQASGRAAVTLTDAALAALYIHDWPGNVRELRNVIERALVLTEGPRLEAAHLELRPASLRPAPLPSLPISSRPGDSVPPQIALDLSSDLKRDLRDFERERIVAALERAAGNQTRAAELLGISRRTLVRRLSEFGLPRPRKSDGEDE